MKPIRWQKKGLIVTPDDGPAWRRHMSGAVCVLPRDAGGYRMYLTGVGDGVPSGLGGEPGPRQIGWIDLDDEFRIARENPANPVLKAGEGGCFDCCGLVAPIVVPVDDRTLYMYYVGFGPGTGRWYDNHLGLAISEDGGDTWRRWSRAPLPLTDERDPIGIGTVWVRRERPDFWRMWYATFTRMDHRPRGRWEHWSHTCYAESADGIHWDKPADNVAIGLADDRELMANRPCVLREPEGYRAWFSYRSLDRPYRIGYAESADGRRFTRRDPGIDVSQSGWDSEQIEYAYVLKRGHEYVLFYNGNGCGATGTGVAIGTTD